jgi:hypothetical protein
MHPEATGARIRRWDFKIAFSFRPSAVICFIRAFQDLKKRSVKFKF